MDDKWQKVREIFDAALRRPPGERRQFISASCGDDKELLAEVESLLASLDSAESFLETPAVAEVADLIETKTKKLDAGKTFGHYEIIKQIGAGGMGEIYLAEDKKLDRKVAVKILNERFSSHEANLKRFIQEAKSASALNHPNILVIHEIGESNGIHYIVSEFIKGETLRGLMRRSPLRLPEILDIAIQISGSLAAAHEAHLVHRDIKPENVMIRPDGFVKVLDFGLAKLVEQKNKSVLGLDESTIQQNQTAKGVILGTVNYMSPEQAKAERVDERADIFSLGVVIYEMIAGRTPFAGDSMSETFANLINAEPLPLARFSANVPDELQRIASKMLRKNRDERYQTMKDVLADLKHLREDLKAEEKPVRSSQPDANATEILPATTGDANFQTAETQHDFSRQLKRHKGRFFAALAVLLLSGFAIGYWFYANRSASGEARQINSIAVLPFENGSGDAGLDYLSDGLSESLIDKLSQLSQLKVIARNSSFKYRGANIDVQDAANKLGVRAIVMGKVTRFGDNLSVRVEMIDAGENRQLWSEQYNRKAADLLAIQQEIAQTASEKLRLRLSGAQEQQLAKSGTTNPQAYELLLKGRFYRNSVVAEELQKSVTFFEQAIAADPAYALAYADLAFVQMHTAMNGLADPKIMLPKAETLLRKALELDDGLSQARVALGDIYTHRWQWQEAETEFRRAAELDPNNADAHAHIAFLFAVSGRSDESIAEGKRAAELDPINHGSTFPLILLMNHRYGDAIEELKKNIEFDPNNVFARVFLGYSYNGKGMDREAVAAFQEAIKMGDKTTSLQIYLGASYARLGERKQAQAILEQLQTTKEYVSPGELAILYTALDDKESAFRSLEQAFAEHDLKLENLKIDSNYDPLRGDARFQDLIRRVGLPQ
jgi:serine/threonine protein kinase/Tfp pilus assembly protein PilF